jgi:hypothetical protein
MVDRPVSPLKEEHVLIPHFSYLSGKLNVGRSLDDVANGLGEFRGQVPG